jgi:hypothetical protein
LFKANEKGIQKCLHPHAKLYHYESASRGVETIQNPRFRKEIKILNKKWKDIIENDPYYNPNLTRITPDYKISPKEKINPHKTILGLVLTGIGIIIALI